MVYRIVSLGRYATVGGWEGCFHEFQTIFARLHDADGGLLVILVLLDKDGNCSVEALGSEQIRSIINQFHTGPMTEPPPTNVRHDTQHNNTQNRLSLR
jgi:hypothetical protein